MDRQYAAQIAYPFTYAGTAEISEKKAFLDILLYVNPDDPDAGAPVGLPAVGPVGAWLMSRSVDITGTTGTIVIRIKVPKDPAYLDSTLDVAFTEYAYIDRTFNYPMTSVGILTIRGDDLRSAVVVNVDALSFIPPGNTLIYIDSVIEPGCVVPCRRKLTGISIYNEYRAKDPADRSALPPDELALSIVEGQTLVLNDGYNCAVSYDEDSEILRITGGVGLGTGQPDGNEWDDEENSGLRGIRTVNGINSNGIVDIQNGAGVLVIGTPGSLEIQLRDQGDDE